MKNLPTTHTGPGLVDIQVNGYAGLNFNGDPAGWTPEAWHDVGRRLRKRGVWAILPTLCTSDVETTIARARRYADLVGDDGELAECFPRLHVEGFFISPEDGPRGAHQKVHCKIPREAPDLVDRINEASGGRVALVTIAPELDGAIELVERCAKAGICPAIGHTQAGPEAIDRAVRAGAKLSTHLGNGSHQMLPRLDNYVQTQLADDRLFASFIADGQHMPLTTLKNFIRAKTPQRSILVTDAMSAAELGPGEYEFAGQKRIVTPEGKVYKPGEDNLAGSAATLDACVIRTFLNCDVTFEEAWAMASTIPAKLVNLSEPPEVTVAVGEMEFVATE